MSLRPLFRQIEMPLDCDAVGMLRELSPQAGVEAFLLRRSVAQGSSFAPDQTILATDPIEAIRVKGQDPFAVLDARLRDLRYAAGTALPPTGEFASGAFTGGILGYLAYDSVRFLENKVGMGGVSENYDAELMLFGKFVVIHHALKRATLIVLSGRESEMDAFERQVRGLRDSLPSLALSAAASATPELPLEKLQPALGKERYLAGVRKLKEHIRDGDIFQAVLSDRFTAPYAGDPLELFSVLSETHPAPYQFFFRAGPGRAFLGASPEMLLKVSARELETHPIAGTRPRGKSAAEDEKLSVELLLDVKEKAEHLMLVDLARNDLGRVAVAGSVRVESFQKTRFFGGVMHLVSVVKGRLKEGLSEVQALASCFPAGTLSGAPKIRAMRLLAELEPVRRGFYGGALVAAGFDGSLDSCITIRSIEVKNGQALIQAGAGIVADSDPEREYEEVRHKTAKSRRALAIAQALAQTAPKAHPAPKAQNK